MRVQVPPPALAFHADRTSESSYGVARGDPTQQSEMGFTLHFNGSGPDGTLDIHADGHSTTNNSGTLTSSVMHVNVSCS